MKQEDCLLQIQKIRKLDEALLGLYTEGKLNGTTHTSVGQESIAIAVSEHLGAEDWVFSNHRCHAHFLAAGGSPVGLLAEVMGRENGVSGGRGGSQHLFQKGFVSGGIQAGLVPVALGAALRLKRQGGDRLALAYIGDGTLGEGVLYESLNMAALWSLPLVVVVENNGIAQATPSAMAVAGGIAARASAFGIKTLELNAFNPLGAAERLADPISLVRTRREPLFVVFDTVRLAPHSKSDDTRPTTEVEALAARDPVRGLSTGLSTETVERIQKRAEDEVRAEVEVALRSAPATLLPSPISPPPAASAFEGDPNRRVVEDLSQGLAAAMGDAPDLILVGEDILAPYGGAFKVTKGISTAFPDRVLSSPISEGGIVGLAAGHALTGGRSVVEIMFGDFITLAADQIVNGLAKFQFIHGGDRGPGVVIRTPMGGGRGYGPTHSQSLEKMFLGIPGLRVVALNPFAGPGRQLHTAATADPGPVLFIEHKLLYPLPVFGGDPRNRVFSVQSDGSGYPTVRLSLDERRKPDIVAVAYGYPAWLAANVARDIFIETEVQIDVVAVTQLSPLPDESLKAQYPPGDRPLVIMDDGPVEAGWSSEIAAFYAENGHRGPIHRVGPRPSVIPAARTLEDQVILTPERVAAAFEAVIEQNLGARRP